MREIKISTVTDLKKLIFNYALFFKPCRIKVEHKQSNKVMYFIMSQLENDKYCLSVCINDMSVGLIYQHMEDYRYTKLTNWIEKYCKTIPVEYIPDLKVTVDLDISDTLSYKDEYIYLYNDTKSSTPMKIVVINDIFDLFNSFILNFKCRLFIIEVSVYVPEFKYTYKKEILVNKSYSYGFDHINITHVQPDLQPINENKSTVGVIYNIDNDEMIDDIMEILHTDIHHCLNLSKEEINIYVYTNCELI